MEVYSPGLSLVLGNILHAWCQRLDSPDLERYLEVGGFQGLAHAAGLSEMEVMAELRSSGLRDRTPLAEPLYLKWQNFQRRHQEGVLVVDAVSLDPASQSGSFLLTRNPFGLVEGLMIAAHVHQVDQVLVRIPAHLQGLEAALLNALERAQSHNLTGGQTLNLQFQRQPNPSARMSGPVPVGDRPFLLHRLETWYHLGLVLSLGATLYRNLGLEGYNGTALITMGGQVKRPGLVEVPQGGNLWQMVETLAGGPAAQVTPLALSLDGGMGGFLPPSEAQIPLAPEEMHAAGVNPAPGTLWLLAKGTCLVDLVRRGLYRYWLFSEDDDRQARNLCARALRMVTEITQDKARPSHLPELKALAREMSSRGLAAAWPLYSSLTYFEDQYHDHLHKKRCPAGLFPHRDLAPCHRTCPAGIDIPSFLAQIGHDRHGEATRIIAQDNPLPFVCGLVCPAPCEGACLRGEMDAPVFIRAMKAVAARQTLAEKNAYPKPRVQKASGRRVAVVGSGPAGLTCAYYLARKGHQVTILEAQAEAGGMLRYGIPAYRLPREVLDSELAQITRLGVKIITGREVKNVEEIKSLGFEACFLALGTQLSRLIPIEGVDLPFVLGGLDFLKDVRGELNPQVGPRVVVVGGGNVAIDVALSAIRQGGHRVDMFCLEKRREMPASSHEVEQALHEGVAINNSWGPVRITADKQITFQRCLRVFDERGRFSPQFDPERTMSVPVDHVILAIGQATDLACVEEGSGVQVERGLICANPDTLETKEPGVFAGGDVVYGPRTVVEAIRSGKRGAGAIHAYLLGRKLDEAALEPRSRAQVEPLSVSAMRRTRLKRAEIPMMEVADRKGNYHQVELGLDEKQALGEASRCLRCDLCIGCGLCQEVCSEMGAEALRLRETKADRLAFNDFTRPSTRCVGCGSCAQVCPTGAIRVVDDGRVRRTVITGSVVREQVLLECSQCGEPYMPQAYLDHLKKRAGHGQVDHVDRLICPQCARSHRARELAGWPFFNAAQA